MGSRKDIITIRLGKGNIGITQTPFDENNEMSLAFSLLDNEGKLGEEILLNEGTTICKVIFDNIAGLENLIEILNKLKRSAYRSNAIFSSNIP